MENRSNKPKRITNKAGQFTKTFLNYNKKLIKKGLVFNYMKFSLFNKKNKQESTKADYSTLGDFEIISMCQLGDKVAFKELVKRYQKIVYAFLYQLAPEWEDLNDLSQEVFIRVFRGIHSLKSPHAFKSWVNQIVVNIFYDELRKRPKQAKNFSIDQAFEHEEFGPELQRQIVDTSSVPDDVFSKHDSNINRKSLNNNNFIT